MKKLGFLVIGCSGYLHGLLIHVEGEGYLRFLRGKDLVYQKKADLKVHKGYITNTSGDTLHPKIEFKGNEQNLKVDLQGIFWDNNQQDSLGQIVLAKSNQKPKALKNGFFEFQNRPQLGNPGEGDWGIIRTITSSSKTSTKFHVKPQSKKDSIQQQKVILEFKKELQTEKDQFTLSDLIPREMDSSIDSEILNVVIGETPTFGATRQLTRYQIESRLKIAGIDPKQFEYKLNGMIKVTRKAIIIPHEDFAQIALECAQKQLGETAQLAPSQQPPMSVPCGDVQLIAEDLKGYGEQWSITVGVYVQGKRFNGRNIRLIKPKEQTQTVKIGSYVNVILKSNAAVVTTQGKVKNILPNQQIQIETKPGVILVGQLLENGEVEVKL